MRPPPLLLIFLLLVVANFSGCMTYHSPARLSPIERNTILNAELSDLVIGVAQNSDATQEQTDQLVRQLSLTHLFKQVAPLSQLKVKPNLVFEVKPSERKFYCLTGPGTLVITTLGIIPVNLGENTKIEFRISTPDSSKTMDFCYEHKSTAWWGSLTSLLALSPNWTLNKIDENRHIQRLAYQIASRKEELRAIARKVGD